MILGMFGEALGLTTCLIAKQKSLSLTFPSSLTLSGYFFSFIACLPLRGTWEN